MLALKEFGITEVSTNYALFEVTVENGLIRQRRLAERFDNLAQRIGLASRYYIKNTQSNQQLVPEEMSSELQRESVVNILSLNCQVHLVVVVVDVDVVASKPSNSQLRCILLLLLLFFLCYSRCGCRCYLFFLLDTQRSQIASWLLS